MTTPVLFFNLWLQSVSLSPVAHLVQNGNQRLSTLSETILHLRGNLRILLPVDQLICLQFLQCGTQRLVGDPPNILFHLVEANHPKTHEGNQGFRFKRYEEAVANVAVTHSPRYAIDMDIAPDETFFVKSGLSYRQISESNDPIGLITAYFKSQGQRAWWLSESTPAAIRMFSDLPIEERNMLIGYCFAHFPEVFSNSQNKFSRCAMWLATEHNCTSHLTVRSRL